MKTSEVRESSLFRCSEQLSTQALNFLNQHEWAVVPYVKLIYSLALIIYAWHDLVTLSELIGVRLLKNDSLNILWICGSKRYSAVTFLGWKPADDQFFKPLMWISRKCSECENGFRIKPAPSFPKSFTVVIYTLHFWVIVFIVRWLGFCVKKEEGGGS